MSDTVPADEHPTIASVMTRHVETARRASSAADIFRLMADRGVCCVVVVEEDRPVGVITDREAVRLLAYPRAEAGPLVAADVMTSPAVCVAAETPLPEAIVTVQVEKLGCFPVVDSNRRLVGLATQSDVLKGLAKSLRRQDEDLEDLAERRTQKIRELVELKDRFLGLVVHDVRGPLCTITMFTEALLAGTVGALSDEQRQAIEHMGRAAQASLDLVNDFVDVGKIRSGRISLAREQQNLKHLLVRCHRDHLLLAQRKGIDFQLQVEQDLIVANVDGVRIIQVLGNLVTNAIKYTSLGGRVVLHARQRGATVEISVRDSGVGISPDRMAGLFEENPNPRARGTSGEVGTGLGLVIVKKLVELHGGCISADSLVGQGTTFTVVLPLDTADQEAPSREPVAAPAVG